MADIVHLIVGGPERKAVVLPGDQWLAVMLKLAGRELSATNRALLEKAEPEMLRQLGRPG